jgi:hypothetical protein
MQAATKRIGICLDGPILSYEVMRFAQNEAEV